MKSKQTSFYLSNVDKLNLESSEVSFDITSGEGNAAAATAFAKSVTTSEGAKGLLKVNLESSSIDVAMQRSMVAVSGMFSRPDMINYNAESYANQGGEAYRAMSVDFNFGAATQDEFGEAFYRTVVIDPQEGRINLKIDIPLVYDLYEHNGPAGKTYGDLYRSAIHAYVDDSILAQTVTKLVPNADLTDFSGVFVPTGLVGNRTVEVAGESRTTRPLKVGQNISLLASANAVNAANKFDATDTIAGLEVSSVVYQVGSVNTGGAGLELKVANSAATGFIPAQAGVETDYQLQNLPVHFVVTADTKLANGNLLSSLTGWEFLGTTVKSVSFSQSLQGRSNFQTGSVNVGSIDAKVTIGAVLNIDGDKILESDADYADIKAAVETLLLSGWYPDATATNLNRRKQGRLMDIVTPERNIPIIFGQPMSVIAPTLTNGLYGTEQFRSIENLTKLVRVVNSNTAVIQLMNDFAGIYSVHDKELDFTDTTLPGLAHLYMRPWAELIEADMVALTQGTSSADVRRNIEAVLLNIILSQTTRAFKETRLSAAASWFAPVDYKPLVVIGTDPELVNFINLQGDPRILGSHFSYKLVSTPNLRMNNLIVWTFSRENPATPEALDPLESGIFAWVPEMVGTATITRGQSTNVEAIVVPRSRHFKNVPIMGMIRVKNLQQALTTAIPFSIDGNVEGLVTEAAPVTPTP